MKIYQLAVLFMGIFLAGGILYLVRRDHLYIRQGLFWVIIALASLAFGTWPPFIDTLGALLDVAYPPTLLLLAAIVVLTVKALLGDIAWTKLSRDVRRLNQRIALLEAKRAERDFSVIADDAQCARPPFGSAEAGRVGPPGFEPGTKGL